MNDFLPHPLLRCYAKSGAGGLSGGTTSYKVMPSNRPINRYVKLRVAHAPGMPGTFSPSQQVSDPDMHHGTCVTHVPWCMPGSLNSSFLRNWRGKGGGGTLPAFPAHAQPAILRKGPKHNSFIPRFLRRCSLWCSTDSCWQISFIHFFVSAYMSI